MTDAPELEPAALEAAVKTFQERTGGFDPIDDRLEIEAIIRAYLAARSAPEAGKAVDDIAKIIDPHSFMDIPFTDDPVLLDMVEQSKQDAIRKAERILSALASSPAPTGAEPVAWRDVIAERQRQVSAEGWSPEHDDEHSLGELARAAACYAYEATRTEHQRSLDDGFAPPMWPWAERWWKPTDRRRDLVKAGALIIAEIERLDRAAKG